MPNLNSTDWLILLLYLFCVIAIGYSQRLNIRTGRDFLQAGRTLPGWICGVAMLAASLGFEEVIALGAAGARYGLKAAMFFSLGAIPALLFAGVAMMPLYYGSGARTAPEYLGLRFDRKTRILNACTFSAMTLGSAGISLYLLARLFQTLQIFDPFFYSHGWPRQGIFTFCAVLSAAIVLAYVLLAGLAGAMVNQGVQFLLMVAGFLPVVVIGLKNLGGWNGLKAALPQANPHSAFVLGAVPAMVLWVMAGFVLGAGRWATDFRILQPAMAAKTLDSARRVPLMAAALRLVVPLLLILPGAIAIGLPTPHSITMVRENNGAIYHEITIVPPDEAQGQGLVPARIDQATGKPLLDSGGHVLLNYDRATPEMMAHFLPTGLLGLGLAALLASLMSGLAASLASFSAVFTCDLYECCMSKSADEGRLLAAGRWAASGGALLSIGTAYLIAGLNGGAGSYAGEFSNVIDALLLVLCLVTAPQLATFLMGMFTRRITNHGAFAGLAAGTAAALLHLGLTLPVEGHAGLEGGWFGVVHRYPGFLAECFWTAILGFAVNVIVAWVVSLGTQAKPREELKGLVHGLVPKAKRTVWWKRPEAIAGAILLAGAVLSLILV